MKTKNIEESGQVLNMPKETVQRKPTTVSYSEAKKLVKKPMSEAQSAHVKKMVEANKLKWEQQRKAKEESQKAQTETLKKQIEEEEVEEVIVLPKRVYPPRKPKTAPVEIVKPKKKKIVYVEESESEEESEVSYENEVEELPKPKPKPKAKIINKVNETHEAIKKIDEVLQSVNKPFNRYSNLIRF